MSPLRSVSWTSPHRTNMLLEVVANAETLVGPLEGTAAEDKGGHLKDFNHIYVIYVAIGYLFSHQTPLSCSGLADSMVQSQYR